MWHEKLLKNIKFFLVTKITLEIQDKILSWEGLGGYFKGRADADWKGTRYFEELAKKLQLQHNN